MTLEPFPLIEIAGPPRLRGRAYGAAAAGRIGLSIGLYRGALATLGIGPTNLAAMVRGLLPTIEAFEPAYVEEMRGIAEGAGRELEEIVLVNARTELLQLARRGGGAGGRDGCTGAVLLPEATAGARLIHGQNWDWRAECAGTGVVLRIRRDDGPDLLTFTEAGGLARSGLNAAGHAITANYLESDRDYRQTGVPLPFVRRKALEAEHLAEVLRLVAATPLSASNNMMVSQSAGFAITIERAPDEAFAIYPSAGLLTHANHWESPAALAKLRDTGLAETPDSLYRGYRLRQLLERDRGRLAQAHLKEALRDRFGWPFAICRPETAEAGGNLGATVASLVMTPAEGLLEICPMPALSDRFTAYRLAPEPARASSR